MTKRRGEEGGSGGRPLMVGVEGGGKQTTQAGAGGTRKESQKKEK